MAISPTRSPDSETTRRTSTSESTPRGRSVTPKRRGSSRRSPGVRSSAGAGGGSTTQKRRSLSPLQKAVRQRREVVTSSATSAKDNGDNENDNTAFLRFVEVHGGQEDHHYSQQPYNHCPKLNESFSSSSSAMDGSSSSAWHHHSAGGCDHHTEAGAATTKTTEWWNFLDVWKQPEEEEDKRCNDLLIENHRLKHQAKTYQYSQDDMLNVALDDKTFQRIQRNLRKKGAVTNTYLLQKIPTYMRTIKKKDEEKQRQRMERARSQSPTRRSQSPAAATRQSPTFERI